MRAKPNLFARLLATSSLVLVPGLAHAQAQPEAGETDSMQIEEIVVTAQKRRESMQDTPLAVSAITAQTIASRIPTLVGSS